MMDWKLILMSVGSTLLEIGLILSVMILTFGYHLQNKRRVAICSFAGLLLSTLSGMLASNIDTALTIDVVIVFVTVVFMLRGKHRFVCSVIAFISYAVLMMFLFIIGSVLFNIDFLQMTAGGAEEGWSAIVGFLIIMAVQIVVYFRIIRKKQVSLENVKGRYLFLLFISEMILTWCFSGILLNEQSPEFTILLKVGCVGFFIVCILLMVIYLSRNQDRMELSINNTLMESKEQYYRTLLEKQQETARLQHDMRNHINCINALIREKDYDNLEKYCREINDYLDTLKIPAQTGNHMVNAIISDISGKYPAVAVTIEGRMPEELALSQADTCVIFYNLLENAFEAAAGAENPRVSLSIRIHQDSLYCLLENTISVRVIVNGNRLVTGKSNPQEHGFGTGNAVLCAKKYGGTVTYSCTDEVFQAEIVLPNIVSEEITS